MTELPKPPRKLSMYEQNRLDEAERQATTAAAPASAPPLTAQQILATEATGRLSVAPITQATLYRFEDLYTTWKRASRGLNRYEIIQAVLDELVDSPDLQVRVAARLKR